MLFFNHKKKLVNWNSVRFCQFCRHAGSTAEGTGTKTPVLTSIYISDHGRCSLLPTPSKKSGVQTHEDSHTHTHLMYESHTAIPTLGRQDKANKKQMEQHPQQKTRAALLLLLLKLLFGLLLKVFSMRRLSAMFVVLSTSEKASRTYIKLQLISHKNLQQQKPAGEVFAGFTLVHIFDHTLERLQPHSSSSSSNEVNFCLSLCPCPHSCDQRMKTLDVS